MSAEAYRHLPPDDLWARVRDALDETAFRVLLERIGSRVYQRCRALLRDDHFAEEAFQNTFCDLIRKRASIPTYQSAAAWAYTAATRHAKHLRRKSWRRWTRERAGPVEAAVSAAPRVDDADVVDRLMADLPDRFRRPIELVFWQGLTHAEAAATLGWPKGTVDAYVAKGLKRLRAGARKRGLAAVAVAALMAQPATAAGEAALDRLATAAWAAGTAPESAGPWWLNWRAAAAGVAGAGLVAGGVTIAGRPNTPAVATSVGEPTPAEPESLQAKNLRLLRTEVVPLLLAQYRLTTPAENPVAGVQVRAFGSSVEVELRPTRAEEKLLPAGLRVRYCVFRHALMYWEFGGRTGWRAMNIPRPIRTGVPNPLAPFTPLIQTVPGADDPRWPAVRRAFARLPDDGRAEAEHLRFLFGPPGGELVLPVGAGVAGCAGGLAARADGHGMYTRGPDERWRYAGECFGWGPVVSDGHVYSTGHGHLRCRRLDDPAAAWAADCVEPPFRGGEPGTCYFVAGRTHVFLTGGNAAWVRPVGPVGEWSRVGWPAWTAGVATGDHVYGFADGRLQARRFADPTAPFLDIGPAAPDCTTLFADGPRLLAYNRDRPGPIYARSQSAGPDDPWVAVGRVHDPYQP